MSGCLINSPTVSVSHSHFPFSSISAHCSDNLTASFSESLDTRSNTTLRVTYTVNTALVQSFISLISSLLANRLSYAINMTMKIIYSAQCLKNSITVQVNSTCIHPADLQLYLTYKRRTIVGAKFATGRSILSPCGRTDDLGRAESKTCLSLETVI